jgi:hypothetical protein
MKTVFKIFGLQEQEIILASWLTSTGIESEKQMAVTRLHLIDFDNKFEAMDWISKSDAAFEHGFEIIETFIK